jgi:hypothetical protein
MPLSSSHHTQSNPGYNGGATHKDGQAYVLLYAFNQSAIMTQSPGALDQCC